MNKGAQASWMKYKPSKKVITSVFLKQTRISLATYYLYLKKNDAVSHFFNMFAHHDTLCQIIDDLVADTLKDSSHITVMHLNYFAKKFPNHQFKIKSAFADLGDYVEKYIPYEILRIYGNNYGLSGYHQFTVMFQPIDLKMVNEHLNRLRDTDFDLRADEMLELKNKHGLSINVENYLQYLVDIGFFNNIKPRTIKEVNDIGELVDDEEEVQAGFDKLFAELSDDSNTYGGYEAIEVTENMDYLLGSAVDLLWHSATSKTPVEDLERAKWFCERARPQFTRHRIYFGGILARDVVCHMGYNVGLAIKHLMSDRVGLEGVYISNLNKAMYYINNEIDRVKQLTNKE